MSIDFIERFVQPEHMGSGHLYCTLFDSGFASRGLAMIESLHRVQPDARIVVFCFDEMCEQILEALSLPHVVIVPLRDLEDPSLLRVKPTRSRGEYCWTSTPSTLLYCLEKLGASSSTYLDADLLFFKSPAPLFERYQKNAIWVTEHRYTRRYDQEATAGRYCVQFMHFKKTTEGMEALRWWREACLEWCYARFEDGKFGDQKYLDDWLIRFKTVAEIKEHGVGVAPWNMQRYIFDKKGDDVYISHSGQQEPVVFFHFHALKLFANQWVDLGPYKVPKSADRCIYKPYIERLLHWEAELKNRFNFEADRKSHPPLKTRLKRIAIGPRNYRRVAPESSCPN